MIKPLPMTTAVGHARTRCPLTEFVNLISGKWAIPVIYTLIAQSGPIRFAALQRAVAPITQKELTRHLRQFEQQGLVTRTVHPDMPPRVEYEVTDLARTLKTPLDGLAKWMLEHGGSVTNSGEDSGDRGETQDDVARRDRRAH
jgi:DNA-binding HxlR family transcriptional regulator